MRFKNQETAYEDFKNNSQGRNEAVNSYVFRFQQATSDSELPEKYLVQKPIKGLHPILGSAVYMQKLQTFEELRETANHCHRGQKIAKMLRDINVNNSFRAAGHTDRRRDDGQC